jgi:hypothetical protein
VTIGYLSIAKKIVICIMFFKLHVGLMSIGATLKICFETLFVGLAYQGKDNVFRFIIEYSSLSWDFCP